MDLIPPRARALDAGGREGAGALGPRVVGRQDGRTAGRQGKGSWWRGRPRPRFSFSEVASASSPDGLITTHREISHPPQRRDAVATDEGSNLPQRRDAVATDDGSRSPRGRGRPRHIPTARAWASLQLAKEATSREGVDALATSPPQGRGRRCNRRRKPLTARARRRCD